MTPGSLIATLVILSLLGIVCGAPPSIRSPSFLSPSPSSSSSSFPSFSFPSPSRPSPSSSSSFNLPSFLQRPSSSSSFSPPSSSFSLPSNSDSNSNSRPQMPDPQQALSTLSSMSQTLAPSFASGLNLIQTTLPAVVSQMAPSQSQLLSQPSTEDTAVDLPASSTPAPITNTAAPSPSSAPVRGQSPFPFVPTDFVNPLDNPTHRTPSPPADSCGQTEFQCQAYKQCYPCYADTSLSQCGTCLNLMKCQDANCQLKQMCNLCKYASSMAVCPMASPYCPL